MSARVGTVVTWLTAPSNCCTPSQGPTPPSVPASASDRGRRQRSPSGPPCAADRLGESAVYFIATRLLRDAGVGPTILVSPLLALMRNQILMAERAGVLARAINSENRDDWEEIRTSISRDEVDLLLVSPERFNNPAFRSDVLPQVAARSASS
jgi:hypothetical protein